MTSKKAQLKIYYLTSTIKRLVENMVMRMDNKSQRTVKKALLRLRTEIDRCVEKLEA